MTGNHEQGGPGRPGPPLAGDETATLLGSLERQRAIFAWKCGGLDAAGLRATLGPSSMTLGGLLKHLALVEDEYFCHRLAAREQLLAQRHEGFWAPMDTLKDKQWLEGLHEHGQAPWQRWAADRESDRDLAVAAG